MDAVFRAVAIYFFLLVIFRIAGSRTISQMTTFDFVLLLIVAEATQQGLIGDDFSVSQPMIVIVTLIGIDIGLSLLKEKLPMLDKWLESSPMVIVEDGKPLREHRGNLNPHLAHHALLLRHFLHPPALEKILRERFLAIHVLA